MEIRNSRPEDFERIMEIYAHARRFMAETGNPNQWGPTNWPPEDLVREDIAIGRGKVCVQDGRVVGAFCYIQGDHIDATYDVIEEGDWEKDAPYGVVHRLAAEGAKGVGSFCLNWAVQQSGYLRVDTHPDNVVMQNLLNKLSFVQRGIIHVVEDNYPRYAYDKSFE